MIVTFYQKHCQNMENQLFAGGAGKMGETGKASNALSGKAALVCWPLYQTTIYKLVSGRKCAPSSNFWNCLLEHSSLIHWRPHVLIFLECWIFSPSRFTLLMVSGSGWL